MMAQGWKQLLAGVSKFRSPGRFPIQAYSEFMPPPRLGRKPYGVQEPLPFLDDDPLGWYVTEYEEVMELQPGLAHLAAQLVPALEHLGHGRPAHGIAKAKLEGNPYWPRELAEHAGRLPHERYVVIAPLALSRTQDDKGRVRWTLFGGSEQGPARAFWKGFFVAPVCEIAAADGLDFFRRLLVAAYGESLEQVRDLRKAGFRILPGVDDSTLPYPPDDELPSWTEPYVLTDQSRLRGVRYLLTFRPFGSLPPAIQRAYLAGELHLLPFPGSLVFWGAPPYLDLQRELPLAVQIPLLHLFPRHEDPCSLRVPQAGWMHEPHPDHPHAGSRRSCRCGTRIAARIVGQSCIGTRMSWPWPTAKTTWRTCCSAPSRTTWGCTASRWPATPSFGRTISGCCWTVPEPTREAFARAAEALRDGGHFGYRFLFPAMQVGRHEVYWHRPLVAFLGAKSAAMRSCPKLRWAI